MLDYIKFVTICTVVIIYKNLLPLKFKDNNVAAQILLPTMEATEFRLDRLNIYPEWITLSGFSSGATFAQQLQISYSSLFSGIAVFSHSYYRCGPGDGIQSTYDSFCTMLGPLPKRLWNPTLSRFDIESYASQGLIESPRNLRGKRLYVFAGTRNALFSPDQSLAILDVYEPYIRSNSAIRTRVKSANLTMPSLAFGGSCIGDSEPTFFISNCDLDGAFDALNFLLGDAVSRAPSVGDPIVLQPLRTFDQTEHFVGVEDGPHELDTVGYIYVPRACDSTTRCFLHFYFHGCRTGREFVGDRHIRNSGFLEVAELNNIIMIFPQVRRNSGENPLGCWDTFGYTGPLFATQRGAQVTVVRNILSRVVPPDSLVLPSRTRSAILPFDGEIENSFGEIFTPVAPPTPASFPVITTMRRRPPIPFRSPLASLFRLRTFRK